MYALALQMNKQAPPLQACQIMIRLVSEPTVAQP